eukprot:scaffold108711_cov59-Phaeocystis_antarctica.AAC.4
MAALTLYTGLVSTRYCVGVICTGLGMVCLGILIYGVTGHSCLHLALFHLPRALALKGSAAWSPISHVRAASSRADDDLRPPWRGGRASCAPATPGRWPGTSGERRA